MHSAKFSFKTTLPYQVGHVQVLFILKHLVRILFNLEGPNPRRFSFAVLAALQFLLGQGETPL